jgi:hypothetical protein
MNRPIVQQQRSVWLPCKVYLRLIRCNKKKRETDPIVTAVLTVVGALPISVSDVNRLMKGKDGSTISCCQLVTATCSVTLNVEVGTVACMDITQDLFYHAQ